MTARQPSPDPRRPSPRRPQDTRPPSKPATPPKTPPKNPPKRTQLSAQVLDAAQRVADTAPPLSAEQKDHLRLILAPGIKVARGKRRPRRVKASVA